MLWPGHSYGVGSRNIIYNIIYLIGGISHHIGEWVMWPGDVVNKLGDNNVIYGINVNIWGECPPLMWEEGIFRKLDNPPTPRLEATLSYNLDPTLIRAPTKLVWYLILIMLTS